MFWAEAKTLLFIFVWILALYNTTFSSSFTLTAAKVYNFDKQVCEVKNYQQKMDTLHQRTNYAYVIGENLKD